jgi:hypothetical protein
MGQKMVRFGQLGAARSRQDESIEVGEVGSKRPSLGCNGVHVTWWGPLIARSSASELHGAVIGTGSLLLLVVLSRPMRCLFSIWFH